MYLFSRKQGDSLRFYYFWRKECKPRSLRFKMDMNAMRI